MPIYCLLTKKIANIQSGNGVFSPILSTFDWFTFLRLGFVMGNKSQMKIVCNWLTVNTSLNLIFCWAGLPNVSSFRETAALTMIFLSAFHNGSRLNLAGISVTQ